MKQITVTLPYPIGEKFGKLTVLSRAENDKFDRTRWNVKCDCGQTAVVALFRLRSGHTKSCGCLRGKHSIHGMKHTKTYNTWCAMKSRCNNKNNEEYKNYGERGIKVCDRWNTSFEAFIDDMGIRPEGTTIDRIDSNGGYSPENCRWSVESVQARNRRSTINVKRDGKVQCVKDWCDELGLNVDTVYKRIQKGELPEEALR